MTSRSESLQTSPYLTCIRPGDPSPIVYAIDEAKPTTPEVTPGPQGGFGVIGLERTVEWHSDVRALHALQDAAAAPVDRRLLIERFGAEIVTDLVDRRWLQPPDQLCVDYLLTTAQIEVTAHCNWGCQFCPVSLHRKPAATMPMPLFREIIEKIAVYDTIRYVTFHFYNEPTLDPHFDERLDVLREHDLRLKLFTNGSKLGPERTAALHHSGVLDLLLVNLPALREDEFHSLTGARTYAASLRNVEAAVELGLPVKIAVNGQGPNLERRVAELRVRFGPLGVDVNPTLLSDRAGEVGGSYHQAVRVDGPLRGCSWPVNHAHFSVTGEMFICCNDYHQRETFGCVTSGSVHEIMTSPRAVLVRRRVFGVAEAPEDYLCRRCHDQLLDFPLRQFRPLATFPVNTRDRADNDD